MPTQTEPKYIDVTPTWEAILPTLLRVHAQATTATARNIALAELQKMARLADERNAIVNGAVK